jgi:zona occludens toxin
LNTHRHRGFDLEVVTQHPKLIDGSVRALVGKHLHFRRLFGGQRSYCYEWDACSDGLSGLANAVGGMYSFPKNVFRWYKSAEIHTKQSFKLPKFLIAFPIAILIGVFAIPKGYAVITNGITGKPINPATAAKVTPSKPASSPVAAAAIAAASAPAVPVPPKGLYERVEEVIAPPKIAGCMTLASRCSCIDVDGKNVVMTPDLCEATSRTLGMMIPYPVEAPKEVRSWKPSVETTAISGPKSSMPHSISTGDIRDLPKRSIVRGSGPSGMGGRS